MSEWIKIAERFPERFVDVKVKKGDWEGIGFMEKKGYWYSSPNHLERIYPVEWMPKTKAI